jgi:hypothetical protein
VRWRRHPGVLWRTAPGYLALSTVSGRTIEVDGPGCDVWSRLAEWVTEEDLVAALARQYYAEEHVVSPDVRSLLVALHAQGYVDRDD